MWERFSQAMEIIDFENAAESFYRERYGISLEDLPFPVRKSLENLFFRGEKMPAATLYSKLAGCGIRLRPGVLLRTRMYSLIKRIPPEPSEADTAGTRPRHKPQQPPLTEEEISFLLRNFPAQVQALRPSLMSGKSPGQKPKQQKQIPGSPPEPGKQG